MLVFSNLLKALIISVYTILLLTVFAVDFYQAIDIYPFKFLPDISVSIVMSYLYWGLIPISTMLVFCSFSWSDFLLRMVLNIHTPTTEDECIIAPALENVIKKYIEKYGKKNYIFIPNIKIKEIPELDAFCFGHNTIILTRGVLENVSQEELEAVIAFECGHQYNSEGLTQMLISICDFIIKCFASTIIKVLLAGFRTNAIIFSILFLFIIISLWHFVALYFCKIILTYIFNFIDMVTLQKKNYAADKFAAELGFAEGMVTFLERVKMLDIRSNDGFLSTWNNTHPTIKKRICRIEEMVKI